VTNLPPFHTSVLDVEADDLIATKIYCVVVRDVHNIANVKIFVNKEEANKSGVEWNPEWLPLDKLQEWCEKNVQFYAAHNGICFDFWVLYNLLQWFIPLDKIIDTLVISRLLQPYREGGHSLDAWGAKLGLTKIPFEDFSKLSFDMITYCCRDTEINVLMYWALLKEKMEWGFTDMSVRLEHAVRDIVFKQEQHGFYLHRERAHKLFSVTKARLAEIENEMVTVFCPQPVLEKVITPKYRKDGKLSSVGLKSLQNYCKEVGLSLEQEVTGPIAYFQLEDFNLGSPPQVKERLLEIGWKPLNLTPKGAPKIDEESLAPFANDFPQVKLLSEYLMTRARNGLAEQWLELADKRGYVHGKVMTNGAVTGRMTHQEPNMANVPSAAPDVPYGKECRACWTVEDLDKYTMVGTDASSLELRMLCHYMDDPEYTKEVLSGDIHTKNQKAAGLLTRAQAKTFIYALLYGAGDGKIGKIIGKGSKDGGKIKARFFAAIPKLGELFSRTGFQAKKHGYVVLLDGRRVWTRSEHSALNSLLQGSGAVVCKAWMVFIHKLAKERNIEFYQLVTVHDEIQFMVRRKDVDKFGQVCKDAMKETERVLKVKCPLDCEWKQGDDWSQTH
jgi:DNA polymerase I